MKRSRIAAAVGAVAVVAVGLVVFSSCSADEDPVPTPTAGETTAPAGDDEGWTRAELEALVFEGDIGTSTVLGSASGEVRSRPTPFPAEVEVTEVTAGPASTLVRFTLSNVDDSTPLLGLESFNARTPLTRDIRDIAIVDGTLGQRLQPFIGVQADKPDTSICTCAAAPAQMSTEGQLLSGTFPPLDPGTTTVTVEIPGFPAIEDVPVTRR